MELSGNKLAGIAGTSRQNIYILARDHKLTKNERGKYESTDPMNANYLREHGIHPETCEPLAVMVDPPSEKQKQSTAKKPVGRKSTPKKTTVKKKPSAKSSDGQKTKTSGKKKTVGTDDEYFDPRERDDISGEEFQKLTGLPEKLLNLTLKEAVLKYGSMHNLKMQADILKTIMAVYTSDVNIQAKRKELIPREFVESRIKTSIELERSQLFDYPDAQIDIIISEILADPEEARRKIPENMRRDFSKIFKESQKQISKQLNDLRDKYDRQDAQQDLIE
jgi:hypothetical protein